MDRFDESVPFGSSPDLSMRGSNQDDYYDDAGSYNDVPLPFRNEDGDNRNQGEEGNEYEIEDELLQNPEKRKEENGGVETEGDDGLAAALRKQTHGHILLAFWQFFFIPKILSSWSW